jgi:6-phosphogluconolactonase
MTGTPQVVVHHDPREMARAAAARLITRIVDTQAARGTASVVLTGGRNGNGLLAALADSPARDAVDWPRLDLWWGDERFLPEGDPQRNVTQATEALLAHVPLDPQRVHPMPPSGGVYGDDADAAAAAYAAELVAAAAPENHAGVPAFDVLLLGVGPDTHVASLFPEHPGVRETERSVVGVRGAPKPRPTRWRWPCPARASSRPPPRVLTAPPARSGCSTPRPLPSSPATWPRPLRPDSRVLARRPDRIFGPAGAPEGGEMWRWGRRNSTGTTTSTLPPRRTGGGDLPAGPCRLTRPTETGARPGASTRMYGSTAAELVFVRLEGGTTGPSGSPVLPTALTERGAGAIPPPA